MAKVRGHIHALAVVIDNRAEGQLLADSVEKVAAPSMLLAELLCQLARGRTA